MSDAPTHIEDEDDEPKTGLTNLAYWDKFVIIVAALLFVCMVALFTMPSFGTALSNVLKQLPDGQAETFHKSSPDEVVITVPPVGSKKPIIIPTPAAAKKQ